ncbi:MAG: DNA translocase FtsK, partial [Treponema lecithinolyticum]|uniref:DNA translocase FtsK n=1 Tax=Treponema lecithinolyticum TaxID=53418 RepID=UPI00361DC9FC
PGDHRLSHRSAADESDEDDIDESESNDEHDVENENENAAERYGTSSPLIPAVPKRQKNKPYNVPAEGLLTTYPDGEYWVIDEETKRSAQALKETLNEFRIEAEVTGIRKGPVVTMFEILPAPGVKLSKIVALGDNIALRLAASSVRIVAPIPGKHAVGIEVPNRERAIVSFKELIDTDIPAFKKMAIPVVLGKDIAGDAQVLDLSKTPHLLIAGSTGSGKSVCVNSLILSILYKRPPQDVRMILIDPKIVELKLYNDIPHLLTPVITEPKKAFQALQYCLCEMERRYALLDGMGVRDIASYNKRIVERKIAAEKLPYIVLIVDEFADLMATTGKELESTVARLAAMSRAVGIHLVLATQRPSIDVITGLIKANIPTRIAFMVASKMDSRIIIDQVGAEKLLGKGDMLYASAVDPFPIRIQGTFVSDTEVENVVDYVKQYGEPDYIDDEIFVDDEEENFDPGVFGDGEDPLYEKALEIVMQAGKASASYIQRRLKIGYNRAARLVEDMEARGIVGPANGSKPREVLHVV